MFIKQMKWVALTTVCAALVIGCGSSEPELAEPPAEQKQTKRMDPLSTQKEALEKAKAVEGQMMQRKDDLDKALDRQEQADPEANVPPNSPQAIRMAEAKKQFDQEIKYAEDHFAMQQMHCDGLPSMEDQEACHVANEQAYQDAQYVAEDIMNQAVSAP